MFRDKCKKLRLELALMLARDIYDVTDEGLFFPRQGVVASGEYFDRINGGDWERTPNLIVDQGLATILNTALGSTAKPGGLFLALFSGSASPASNWTAANFATNASEIVSTTEGYTNATRPVWTSTPATAGSIDNLGSVATVTIATASSLNVNGAAMLTNSTRGGTTGALVSATKYSATRVFQDADTYDVGYRINLTV